MIYDIALNNNYSKSIVKYIIFEEVFNELIETRWHPSTAYDWCFDEEMKATFCI